MYVLTCMYVYKPGVYSLLVSIGVGILVAGVMVTEVEEDRQLPYTVRIASMVPNSNSSCIAMYY